MSKVRIGGFTNPGFVGDRKGHDLPPDVWTEVRNVRFNSKGAVSFWGDRQLWTTGSAEAPLWLKPWPPVDVPLWMYAGLDEVWVFDGTTHTEVTRASGDYTAVDTERWHGDVLNGIGVLNNTIDVPQMWTEFDASTPLADLTNWPATHRAKFLRPWKFFLFAGHLTVSGVAKPYRLLWSHPAEPGTIPASWDITDPTKDAGEFDIAETEDYLVDGLSMGETFIVYKQNNVHAVQYIGRPNIFRQVQIIPGKGLLARDCAHRIPGGHFAVGLDDVYIHSGVPGSEKSLVEGRFRDNLFNQISSTSFYNCYTVDYKLANESWFCYPEQGEEYPTKALVWNRKENSLGFRDLHQSPFISTGPMPAITPDDDVWGE